MARNDNLRLLDENEKRENRSVLTGLYGKVRLTRLHRCENRTVLNPPPILEARGLPTDLLLVVPQGPDACVADLKAASLAADANAGVALMAFRFCACLRALRRSSRSCAVAVSLEGRPISSDQCASQRWKAAALA